MRWGVITLSSFFFKSLELVCGFPSCFWFQVKWTHPFYLTTVGILSYVVPGNVWTADRIGSGTEIRIFSIISIDKLWSASLVQACSTAPEFMTGIPLHPKLFISFLINLYSMYSRMRPRKNRVADTMLEKYEFFGFISAFW